MQSKPDSLRSSSMISAFFPPKWTRCSNCISAEASELPKPLLFHPDRHQSLLCDPLSRTYNINGDPGCHSQKQLVVLMPQFLAYPTRKALEGPIFRKWTFKIAQWCLFLPWFLNPVSGFTWGFYLENPFVRLKPLHWLKRQTYFLLQAVKRIQQIHTSFQLHKIQLLLQNLNLSVFFEWYSANLLSQKYYNLSMKSVLLDVTTKPDFLHRQGKQKKKTPQENSTSNPRMPVFAFNTNITISNLFIATCFYWKTNHN